MNNKDFTEYSTKCTQIIKDLIVTMTKFTPNNNYTEKEYQNLADQMKDLELLLDQCYVDVEETVTNITKNKNEVLNKNNYSKNRGESENSNINSTLSFNDGEVERKLIESIVNKLKNTKLSV